MVHLPKIIKVKNESLVLAIGTCFFVKIYYPVLGTKDSEHGSLLHNLNRSLSRSAVNGAMKNLDEAVKEADKVKSLYNY